MKSKQSAKFKYYVFVEAAKFTTLQCTVHSLILFITQCIDSELSYWLMHSRCRDQNTVIDLYQSVFSRRWRKSGDYMESPMIKIMIIVRIFGLIHANKVIANTIIYIHCLAFNDMPRDS